MPGGSREPLLRLLFLGIQRASVGKSRAGRKPITTKRLIRFVGAVDNLVLGKLESTRLRALMLLAFWGIFRGSELCTKYGETKFLRHRDVVVGETSLGHRFVKITLQKTKTNQHKSSQVYIYENRTKFCAVAAVAKFIKVKEKFYLVDPNSHFFYIGLTVGKPDFLMGGY